MKWNAADTLIAAGCASPHYAIQIVDTETMFPIHGLKGHTLAPKSICWDPIHPSVLMTGGRDGTIRLWDLRSKEEYWNNHRLSALSNTRGAHDEWIQCECGQMHRLRGPCRKAITGLSYDAYSPYDAVSANSFDGWVAVFYFTVNLMES